MLMNYKGGWIIYHLSIAEVHFVFYLNFIVLFPYLINTYYHIMFINIAF